MSDNIIELAEKGALINLPEHAVECDITVTVFEDGKLQEVRKKMSMDEIREAFKLGDDAISSDDIYVLTDKGREYLEELRKEFE